MKRIIASALIFAIAALPAQAATPNQYNPNTVVPTGIDSSTLNATAPFIDHTTGGVTVTVNGSAASSVPISVNVSQIGGASAVTGTGPSASGVPRVTVSNDSTVAISGVVSTLDAATGLAAASAPLYAVALGGRDASGNLQQIKTSPYAGENALVVDNVANGTSGASAPAQVGVIAGLDSASNVRPVRTSASGVPYVITEGVKASYRLSASDVLPVASATDVVTVCGSATTTVRVNRFSVTADATSAGVIDFYVFKSTTADTGGAASSVAIGQMDSNDPAPTATALKYTANPATLGTRVLIASDHYALPAAASTGIPVFIWAEDFGTRNNEALVLRGTGQCLVLNMNGQTVPAGMSLYFNVGLTEE